MHLLSARTLNPYAYFQLPRVNGAATGFSFEFRVSSFEFRVSSFLEPTFISSLTSFIFLGVLRVLGGSDLTAIPGWSPGRDRPGKQRADSGKAPAHPVCPRE